jgi:hypothetical protein
MIAVSRRCFMAEYVQLVHAIFAVTAGDDEGVWGMWARVQYVNMRALEEYVVFLGDLCGCNEVIFEKEYVEGSRYLEGTAHSRDSGRAFNEGRGTALVGKKNCQAGFVILLKGDSGRMHGDAGGGVQEVSTWQTVIG